MGDEDRELFTRHVDFSTEIIGDSNPPVFGSRKVVDELRATCLVFRGTQDHTLNLHNGLSFVT